MKLTNNLNNSSKNPTKFCVIYGRISATKIHNEDASLDAQLELGRKYANLNCLEVIGEFTESVSGKSTKNRHEFKKAVELATKHGCHLWVYSLSRFARSTMDVLKHVEIFEKKNVKLVSHSENLSLDNASSLLQISILSSFVQYEANLASERTKTALNALRESGKRYSGRIPYGMELVDDESNKLVKNSFEQKQILFMKNLREEGFSFQKIADILNQKGVETKVGGKWIKQSVRSVINRKVCLDAEEVKTSHEPISA